MIDSHIHLSYKYYDQTFPYIDLVGGQFRIVADGSREVLIDEMKQHGVSCCIEPAIDVDSNELLLSLSEEYEGFVLPAVGNHPTRCIWSKVRDFKRVRAYSENKRVVAIGETGLDYHYERKDQHRLRQKIWFRWLINLADERNLPLVLHIRMADKDAIRILRKNKQKQHGGVCHCFGGGPDAAKIYTEELGFCLGIGGTLLMKDEISAPLQQAVTETPLQYLMLKTDGPYVKLQKPEGITGKRWAKARNTSLILPAIAKEIAELKGLSTYEVIRCTEENTRRVFNLNT